MITIKDKISITPEQARYILEKETKTHGIYIDLERVLDYQAHFLRLLYPLMKKWRKVVGGYSPIPSEKEKCKRFVMEELGIPQYRLIVGDKISLDQNVVDNLLRDEHLTDRQREFFELYKDISSYQYSVSYLEQYRGLPLVHEESFEGHRMVLARPEWTILTTNRISAKAPSIQNIDRRFADIITYPKGKIMLFSDSGQIEPRITYSHYIDDPLIKQLIILYNDAYFGQLHYCLMSDKDKNYFANNLDKLEKVELDVSLRKKLKLFGLAGNYGGKLTDKDNPELAQAYTQSIVEHASLKAREATIRESVYSEGVKEFADAFGNVIKPKRGDKYKTEQSWMNHLVRCGLNNPIQGTASALMCESVYQAYKLISLEAKGDTHIGYYKHDEGMFYIDEKDEGLIDKFIGCLSYQVNDWIPIYSDRHIGKKKGMNVDVIKP